MSSSADLSDEPAFSSPWPLLVAFGFALSEVGVLFGLVPVVVGGLLLFGGSCAGILRETEYVKSTWTALRVIGILFSLVGGALWVSTMPSLTVDTAIELLDSNSIALRGASILVGGLLLMTGGLLGPGWASRIPSR